MRLCYTLNTCLFLQSYYLTDATYLCLYLWALTWTTFLDVLVLVQNQSPYYSVFPLSLSLSPLSLLTLLRLNHSLTSSHIISREDGRQPSEMAAELHTDAVSGACFLSESHSLMPLTPVNLCGEIEFPEQRGTCGKTVDCGRHTEVLLLRDFQTNIVGRLRVVLSIGQIV